MGTRLLRIILGTSLLVGAASAPITARAADEDPVVVAVGDIACDPADPNFLGADPATCQQRATAALVPGAAAVLALGDLQYETPSLDKFRSGYGAPDSWGPFNLIAHPAIGNHEYEEAGAAGYFDYFAENGVTTGARDQAYYSFNLDSWHLVALNSNCSKVAGGCDSTSPQTTWLRNDLIADTRACEIAYWHHPRFSSVRTSKAMGPVWKQLYRLRVDIVLNGHQHNYERFALQKPSGIADPVKGVRQFTVGSGGRNHQGYVNQYPTSEFRNDVDFGVLRLTLHPTSYDWAFVTTSGTIVDSGTQPCH